MQRFILLVWRRVERKEESVDGENVGTTVFIRLAFTLLHKACFQNTVVPGPLGW